MKKTKEEEIEEIEKEEEELEKIIQSEESEQSEPKKKSKDKSEEGNLTKKARVDGLMSLTKKELGDLADKYQVPYPSKTKKKKLAKMIKDKTINKFCLGKKIKVVMVKTAISGYKTGIVYPVDKKTLDFFIKYNVLK